MHPIRGAVEAVVLIIPKKNKQISSKRHNANKITKICIAGWVKFILKNENKLKRRQVKKLVEIHEVRTYHKKFKMFSTSLIHRNIRKI